MPSQPNNKKTMTLRIRSAGPMTLARYTDSELSHLRKVVSSPKSKIKYLALAFNRVDKSVQVVAQAFEKLSTAAWREALWCNIKITVSTGNLQATIDSLRRTSSGGFEEYGLFGRHGQHKPTTSKADSEEEPVVVGLKSDNNNTNSGMIKRCSEIFLNQAAAHKAEALYRQALALRPLEDPDSIKMSNSKKKLKKTQAQVLDGMRTTFLMQARAHKAEALFNQALVLRPVGDPAATDLNEIFPLIKLLVEPISVENAQAPSSDMSLFLSALVNSHDLPSTQQLSARDLFAKFEWFVMNKGSKIRASEKNFGGDIKDIDGLTKKKASTGVVYTVDRAAIKAFLVGKNEYDQDVKF
jgi:hypothetical protein